MGIFDTDKIKTLKKGTIILREGEVCRFGCKVIKGCLKSYILDKSGKEYIMQFAPEDWIISDISSMYYKTPSNMFIEAIEDSEVYWIENEMFEALENANKDELLTQVKMLLRNVMAANKRTKMLLSSTSEERYNDFIQTYPTLTQRLPLKMIASYIGVTPEYLSEIRRKAAGK